MARGQTNKLYRTFVKGLITEAGPLTYPENASTDELNTVLKRKGSRSRRFGLDYEPSSVGSTIASSTVNDITTEYLWRAVGNNADNNFLCIQVNSTIHFYDADDTPVMGTKKSFTIDLLIYKVSTALDSDVKGSNVEMVAGKGWLFIAQEFIDPIIVEYDSGGDTISVIPITIQMRDFDGVSDGLANDEEPTTLSKEHYYNLRNQGWLSPGSLGILQGAGTTNPYTPGSPPATSSDMETYDPYTGERHFRGIIP